MKLIGKCGEFEFAAVNCDNDGGDEDKSTTKGGGGRGGALVVVGVKLDTRSKELLTWALVKVAKAGDQVIGLHVIHPCNDGAATFLEVKKFDDSLVSACDGLCNLKQVDLTFKVCRGTQVRQVLARIATSSGAISLVVGTSVTHNAVRSPISVARYCATHVRRDITVFGVDNGKIMFKREGIIEGNDLEGLVGAESRSKTRKTLLENEESGKWLSSSSVQDLNSTTALVPVKREGVLQKNSGWAFLRKLFVHKETSFSQSPRKKPSLRQWISILPRRTSLSTICPDHEQGASPVVGVVSNQLLSDYEYGMFKTELAGKIKKYISKCRLFSYQELVSATSNFKAENVVGKGGYSDVYKGIFRDGKEAAVKILKPYEDVLKQFVSEIEILTSLDHKNIVTLLGFCFEKNHLLLVYDLLSRGSLEDNLHGNRKAGSLFGLQERHKVALGVAEAMEHLHISVAEPIIHRDVKSSNILLSDDFEPKLSDFGLARLASSSSHNINNVDIEGTFGYLAPEYVMHGKLLDKIDVYAYGVVLLELLSGRKPVDNENTKSLDNLVTWAKRIMKEGTLEDLLDSTLVVSSHFQHLFQQMVLAAGLCIGYEQDSRPHMSLVLKLLQGDPESIKLAREQVNASNEYEAVEDEQSATNIQSFINMAFLNLEDDNDNDNDNE